jgi:hypothetical protein
MLSWIVQQVIISLILIVLIHSIYKFLQVNLTTPKVRDLVTKPSKQYEEIYNTFKESPASTTNEEPGQENETLMKSELQNYLKELSSENTRVQKNPKKEESLNKTITELEPATFSDNFTPAYETF